MGGGFGRTPGLQAGLCGATSLPFCIPAFSCGSGTARPGKTPSALFEPQSTIPGAREKNPMIKIPHPSLKCVPFLRHSNWQSFVLIFRRPAGNTDTTDMTQGRSASPLQARRSRSRSSPTSSRPTGAARVLRPPPRAKAPPALSALATLRPPPPPPRRGRHWPHLRPKGAAVDPRSGPRLGPAHPTPSDAADSSPRPRRACKPSCLAGRKSDRLNAKEPPTSASAWFYFISCNYFEKK